MRWERGLNCESDNILTYQQTGFLKIGGKSYFCTFVCTTVQGLTILDYKNSNHTYRIKVDLIKKNLFDPIVYF